MTWEQLPTQIRRTVDEVVERSGLSLRRSGEPTAREGAIVIPFVRQGEDGGPVEVVVARDGSAVVRAVS